MNKKPITIGYAKFSKMAEKDPVLKLMLEMALKKEYSCKLITELPAKQKGKK